MKKKPLDFMVCLRHIDNQMIVSRSKTAIAKHCNIDYITVHRHRADACYSTSKYTIWYNVEWVRTHDGK
jgi:hypothetical protein